MIYEHVIYNVPYGRVEEFKEFMKSDAWQWWNKQGGKLVGFWQVKKFYDPPLDGVEFIEIYSWPDLETLMKVMEASSQEENPRKVLEELTKITTFTQRISDPEEGSPLQ